MNSRILDVYPKIPLFTTLLLFTITFFVYDDFGIRMIFGYAALMYVALIYLIFRNNNLRVTRMKALYLILALNLSILILSGSVDSSSIAFVIGIVICALVALVGDVRRSELPAAFRILIVFSILISLYVVAVRFNPSLYLNHVRPHLSAQSQATNEWLIKEGYGVTLGGNIVFIDYVLTLCGLICFNLILAYKEKLKFRWLYWGCIGICAVGMLFVNRKSEILAYAAALFFCFWMHMGASTRKEKKRILIAAVVLLIAGVAALSYLARTEYLERYVTFVQRIISNIQGTDVQMDVTSGRTTLWKIALSFFIEHPILGIGWGHFKEYIPAYMGDLNNVHNNYIQLLCETGVVGFLLVMVPLVLIFRETIKLIRVNKKRSNREPLLMALNTTSYGMQISFFVLSFLDPCLYKLLFWALFAIAAMFACCTENSMIDIRKVEDNGGS